MEYKCTRHETEHTTKNITEVIVSKRKPQEHVNKSVFIQGVKAMIQKEFLIATS
jgi:hypothetical protein